MNEYYYFSSCGVISPLKFSFAKSLRNKYYCKDSIKSTWMSTKYINEGENMNIWLHMYMHCIMLYKINILSYHKEESLYGNYDCFFITLKYCSCFSAFIVPSFSCLRQELKMKSSVSLSHPFSSLILTSSCLTRLPLSGESRSRGPNPLCPTIVSWIFSPRVF